MQILAYTDQRFQEVQKYLSTPPKYRWQKRILTRITNGKRLSNCELKILQRWLREVGK
jgi:hypothetical protein